MIARLIMRQLNQTTLFVTFCGFIMLDFMCTAIAINAVGITESNPVFVWIWAASNRYAMLAIIGVVKVAECVILWYVAKLANSIHTHAGNAVLYTGTVCSALVGFCVITVVML